MSQTKEQLGPGAGLVSLIGGVVLSRGGRRGAKLFEHARLYQAPALSYGMHSPSYMGQTRGQLGPGADLVCTIGRGSANQRLEKLGPIKVNLSM